MLTNREKIRQALGSDSLSVSDVTTKTGLSNRTVATILSALANDTKEATAIKPLGGGPKLYKLKNTHRSYDSVRIADVGIKLSQLRTYHDKIRQLGVSFIDDIVKDYEMFYSNEQKDKS